MGINGPQIRGDQQLVQMGVLLLLQLKLGVLGLLRLMGLWVLPIPRGVISIAVRQETLKILLEQGLVLGNKDCIRTERLSKQSRLVLKVRQFCLVITTQQVVQLKNK